MALGKNLKRQKLIPEEPVSKEESKKKVTKVAETKKSTKTKKRAKSTKTKKQSITLSKSDINVQVTSVNINPEKNTTVEVQEAITEAVRSPEPLPASPVKEPITAHFISETEFQRRQQLKEKFEEELEQLAGKTLQLIVFRLGNSSYALEIDKTREVVVTPAITATPHAPHYIKGVATIRGEALVVMDLAAKYNMVTDGDKGNASYTVVIESDLYDAGILVNDVPNTLIVSGDDLQSASGIMADTALDETYIKGIIEIEGKMIFLIDIDELIEGDKVSFIPQKVN